MESKQVHNLRLRSQSPPTHVTEKTPGEGTGPTNSEIPASLDYDAFGRIYEYFLGEFAMSEGQGGRVKSELRSPKSELPSVRHSSFVLRHLHRLSIHGVEKTGEPAPSAA